MSPQTPDLKTPVYCEIQRDLPGGGRLHQHSVNSFGLNVTLCFSFTFSSENWVGLGNTFLVSTMMYPYQRLSGSVQKVGFHVHFQFCCLVCLFFDQMVPD